MVKTVLSPLFITLLVLWPVLVWQFVKKWRQGWLPRILLGVAILALALLTATSLTNVNRWLYYHLELEGSYDITCPQDAVVVLGGGYSGGSDPSEDQLDAETALRVMKGVQVFDKCQPRYFIVSGTLNVDPNERMAELMRDLAVHMNVPDDRIVLEVKATKTREHPLYTRDLGIVAADAKLAVVTSPWHLRRAMVEFNRIFPNATPVAAYYISSNCSYTLDTWFPHSDNLANSTRLIHEYIGIVWYDILKRYYSDEV